MTAWAFETVGVTPSKVKGSAVTSNAVPMTSFFMGLTPYIVSLMVLGSMLENHRPSFLILLKRIMAMELGELCTATIHVVIASKPRCSRRIAANIAKLPELLTASAIEPGSLPRPTGERSHREPRRLCREATHNPRAIAGSRAGSGRSRTACSDGRAPGPCRWPSRRDRPLFRRSPCPSAGVSARRCRSLRARCQGRARPQLQSERTAEHDVEFLRRIAASKQHVARRALAAAHHRDQPLHR